MNLMTKLIFSAQKYDVVSSGQTIYNATTLREGKSLLIKRIWSEGVTYASPKKSSSQTHTITVSQLLELEKISHIYKPIEVNNFEELSSLSYDTSEFYSFKFSTDEDTNKIIGKVLRLIFILSSDLEKSDFQRFERYNSQNSHMIPLLITFLRKLDVNLLQNVLDEIENRNNAAAMDLFVKMLPLVGSRDSAHHVINLIKQKRIKDHVALYALSSMPFNIRQTSERLLHELESMTDLPKDVSDSVQSSSTLSFATLIHRTCKSSGCSNETTNKYARRYLQYIHDNADNYEKQQLYMTCLQNMQPDQALNVLLLFVYEEEHLQFINLKIAAMRAIFSIISSNPEKVNTIFWPILSNRNNSLEVRASALMFILRVEISLTLYLRLHWLMTGEPCQHLYNLYFKLTKRYAESKDDCVTFRSDFAHKVLAMAHKPKLSTITTSHFKFDISAVEFIEITTIANTQTEFIESLYISCTRLDLGYYNNYFSVYFKIQGLKEEYLKLFIKLISEENPAFPILDDPLHIEVIVYFNNQAVAVKFYNNKNISKLSKDIIWLLNVLKETPTSFYHVSSISSLEMFFVTDLGMPGVLSADYPSLSVIHNDPLDGFFARYWSQGSTVFKVKNTIANIWQGIITTHVSRFNLPLHIKLNFTAPLALQMKLPTSLPTSRLLGFEWHINTDIFTVTYHDKFDALVESCKTCKGIAAVSSKRKSRNVLDSLQYSNFSLKTAISDCDDEETFHHIQLFHNKLKKQSVISFLGILATGGYLLKDSLSQLPVTGSCSYSSVFAPKDNNNITFGLNVNQEHSKTEDSSAWQNKTTKVNLDLLDENILQSEDKESHFKSSLAKLVIEECVEKDGLSVDDVCFIDQCKRISETLQRNKLIRFSTEFSKVSNHVEEMIHNLINTLKTNVYQQWRVSANSTTPLSKVETELELDCMKKTYSFNLSTSSKILSAKHLPFDLYSTVLLSLKNIVQYISK